MSKLIKISGLIAFTYFFVQVHEYLVLTCGIPRFIVFILFILPAII